MNIFIVLPLLFVFYLIVSYVSKIIKLSDKELKGPKPIPILGNLHLLEKLPHRDFMKLSKIYGDNFKFWMGDYYTVVISDPVIARQVLITNHNNFINRVENPTFALTSKNYTNLAASRDAQWNTVRKLVSNTFTKTKLKLTGTVMEKQADLLIKAMSDIESSGQPFISYKYSKKFALNIIFSLAFSDEIPYNEGLDEGRMGLLVGPLDRLFIQLGAGSLVDYIKILQPIYLFYCKLVGTDTDTIYEFVSKIYDEHEATIDRNNPRDLMDTLIIESEGHRHTCIMVSQDMILGGSDTSATTIDWLLVYLANNPVIQEKMAKELREVVGVRGKLTMSNKVQTPYTNAVIKEVLRLRPVGVFGLPRNTKESILLNNEVFVPKGAQVIINFFAICNSDKHWKDPEVFNPDRFLGDEADTHSEYYVPFSLGTRDCVGKNLAVEEIYIAVSNIISNFKISSSDGKKIDEGEVYGLTIKPKPFSLKLEKRV